MPANGLIVGAAAATLAGLLLLACSPPARDTLAFSGATMGTQYQVVVPGLSDGAEAQRLRGEIRAALGHINALMSTWDLTSEISRFNAYRGTDWFAIADETLDVIAAAQAISRSTGGAFDITVGPLVDLWGFGPDTAGLALPDVQSLEAAQAGVGYHKLDIRHQPPAIRKRAPQLQIDLSAIAKGYGVDRLAEIVARQGHEDYLIEIGGELRVAGRNARGQPWQIAIERPSPEQRVVHRVIDVSRAGVATSGDYRNFLEVDGRRYAHGIDPRTGRPVAWSGASVTVLAETAMQADALATALMILGPDAAMAYAETHAVAVLLLVHEQGQLRERRSRAFAACFVSPPAGTGCRLAAGH